jgi:hypothetical protein
MGKYIVNLTQHAASAEQIAAGVVDLGEPTRKELCRLLTFEHMESKDTVWRRAVLIAGIAAQTDYKHAMIGGALWLMAPLASQLRRVGLEPCFAFSRRETVEETLPDGSVRKTAVFRHAGFMDAV